MQRRSVFGLIGAAALTAALLATASPAAAQDTIKIGMPSALTGPYNE